MEKICALCQEKKKLCNSHLIPRAIFKELRKKFDGKSVHLDGNSSSLHGGKTQEDFSEPLLCKNCDNLIIGKYERYGVPFFRMKQKGNIKISKNGVTFQNVKYLLLKQYLVSLIWRFSVSKNFDDIKLVPKMEESARLSLLSNKPLGPLTLGCGIQKIIPDNNGHSLNIFATGPEYPIMKPFPINCDGYLLYGLIMNGFYYQFCSERIRFKFRNTKGLVNKSKIQLFPNIPITKIPAIQDSIGTSMN